jgi:hypothetical protein
VADENNCHCSDHRFGTYEGLVRATRAFGFQGIKMDRAGLISPERLKSFGTAIGWQRLPFPRDSLS